MICHHNRMIPLSSSIWTISSLIILMVIMALTNDPLRGMSYLSLLPSKFDFAIDDMNNPALARDIINTADWLNMHVLAAIVFGYFIAACLGILCPAEKSPSAVEDHHLTTDRRQISILLSWSIVGTICLFAGRNAQLYKFPHIWKPRDGSELWSALLLCPVVYVLTSLLHCRAFRKGMQGTASGRYSYHPWFSVGVDSDSYW